MKIIIAFAIGFLFGAGCLYLWIFIEQRRFERKYQKYLASHCKYCGDELDESGKACSCWAENGWFDYDFLKDL